MANVDGGSELKGMEMVESREWYMAAYAPDGVPSYDHLKLRTAKLSLAIDSIQDHHVAIEILLISVEPYLLAMVSGRDDGLYLPQLNINEVIRAAGIGRVIHSKDENYKAGDVILCPFLPIAEYCVLPSQILTRKIDPTAGTALPDYLSLFGMPGFAAWVGIEQVGEAKAGDNVFISAAAGGVGMCAGQLAKLKGCRVVGSTGSDEKVKLLMELGYDDAFNYKTETDLDAALNKYFPKGIDVYLDNVGGKMLEAVLNHVNKKARISLCGMISQYNQQWEKREGVRKMLNVVGKEVRMEGYMIGSYMDRFGYFTNQMEGYRKQGEFRLKHKIYYGIESFLDCFSSLFSGSNLGKPVIQVRD